MRAGAERSMTMELYRAARRLVECGMSVIPIKPDGSKGPMVAWQPYQERRATPGELRRWFPEGTLCGLAVVNGAVSGNLETLDIDEVGLLDEYLGLCNAQGLGDLRDTLPIVKTPSGGSHLYFRSETPPPGNLKLAWTVGRQVRIETRGEGGYALIPPSGPACHPDGRPYVYRHGDLARVPTLAPDTRDMLITLARTFNEAVEPGRIVTAPERAPGDTQRPGDDYNARMCWEDLLPRYGWQVVGARDGKQFWRRPGKAKGVSATTGYGDSGLLYVFSSNAVPFEADHAYSPFSAYALLAHGGDAREAARALAALGYGGAAERTRERHEPATLSPPGKAPAARKPIRERMIDLADVPPPPADPPFLWGPYLIAGAGHWMTGKTGLGKSTFIYNMATALAEGVPLWEIPCVQRRVLYVDMESGDDTRSRKISRLYKDAPRIRGQLLFLREPVRLPEETEELLPIIADDGFDLVIFDTARRVFAVKDENDNAEFYARIVPTLDALKALGVATLTLGHPSKNGLLGARGAGAQEDAGDVNLTLAMHRGEVEDANGIIKLSITKNRVIGLGHPPLYLRRLGDDRFARVSPDEAAQDSAHPPQGTVVRCTQAILEALEASPRGHAGFADLVSIVERQGFSRAAVQRALKEMEAQAMLVHTRGCGYGLPGAASISIAAESVG